MYHDYTQEELRSYCRTNIETLETWARNLIHEQMKEEYGIDYVNKKCGEEFIIKKDIRNHIESMMKKEPDRFKRPVDTLFIDQIVYFLCNPKWYKNLFKPALDYIYPQGKDEARTFLSRLIPIRNPLSHSNSITMHDVERAICYSHDFIEGLKEYYQDKGEEQVYNVPRIIKVKDSLGNVFDNIVEKNRLGNQFVIPQNINCGDKYSVEIEVDSSFDETTYTIAWYMARHNSSELGHSSKLTIEFTTKDVSETAYIQCKIVQNKDWHKYGDYDSVITLCLKILPPKEE